MKSKNEVWALQADAARGLAHVFELAARGEISSTALIAIVLATTRAFGTTAKELPVGRIAVSAEERHALLSEGARLARTIGSAFDAAVIGALTPEEIAVHAAEATEQLTACARHVEAAEVN